MVSWCCQLCRACTFVFSCGCIAQYALFPFPLPALCATQNAALSPAPPYALGSNASGCVVGAFSAPPAGSTPAVPSAMEGSEFTTGSVTTAVTGMTNNDNHDRH